MSAPGTSAPYVTTLRAHGTIELVPEGTPGALRLRVEMPEIWDVVGVVALPGDTVMNLKLRALETLFPHGEMHEEFVLKLRGWEVLDESATLAEAGAVDGSIFLLTHRRKRPIR